MEYKKLGEIGTFIRGNGLQKKDFVEKGVGCIHYGQIYTYYGLFATKTKSFVTPELASKLRKAQKGDLIITTTSENVEDVCKAVAWLGDEEIAIGSHSTIFRPKIWDKDKTIFHYHIWNVKFNRSLVTKKYLYHFFLNDINKIKVSVTGSTMVHTSMDRMKKRIIPIPPLEEQERIVSILDKFEALVNDLTSGLPAEIAALQEQYEYYRNKLLTLKRSD